jgi:hypothetical protein
MKNKLFLVGILAFMLVFGMTVIGCDNEPTDPGINTKWSKFGDNITISVDDNDTITVNITQESSLDEAGIHYAYDGEKNKTYKLTFQAWTKTGTRDLRVGFGSEERNDGTVWYPNVMQDINSTKQTYILERLITDKWADFYIWFNCGDTIGEFYVKIISIVPLS